MKRARFSWLSRATAGYLRGDRAVSALEYAILAGVVAVALVAALTTFSDQVSNAIDGIGTRITSSVSNVGN